MRLPTDRFRHIALTPLPLLILIAIQAAARGEDDDARVALRQEAAQAAAVLSSDVSREAKVNACRRLAAIGGRDAIGPLAALLADEQLSHAARMGLEAIPDLEAGEALRGALSELHGAPLIGVINSLGARRHQAAVPDLGPYLTDGDAEIASAACAALGNIASPDALELLEDALPHVAAEVLPAMGDACLRVAVALRRQGLNDQSARVCQLLRIVRMPDHIRRAATRQVMLARPADAGPLLQELLASGDGESRAMALTVARELVAPEIIGVLIASLPGMAPADQASVIAALGDRGDAAARDVLAELAHGTDLPVRVAAIRALGNTGDVSTVPLLLEAAGESEAEIVAAARTAVATLQGDGIDAAIVSAFEFAQEPVRRLLIDVIGQRRINSAVPALLPLADAADQETRLAALRALGQIIDLRDLNVLTERLAAASSPEELAVVREAIRAACRRSIDPDACAGHLKDSLPRADLETKIFLIELLGTIGGATALDTVVPLAMDAPDEIQDAVTRVLGQWRTPDVAPALLDVARGAPQEKFRIRALRGYLRVIRQMDLPDEERLAMVRRALSVATRPEERVLGMETLGRVPTLEALHEAIAHLDQESLRAGASAAAVAIAERIVLNQPAAVAEPMRRVLAASGDPDVTRRAQAVLEQVHLGQ